MKICVTVLTLVWNVAEIKIGMTVDALHFGVAPAQRKPSLRMFEIERGSERFPALSGVALLARNLQLVAVRTTSVQVQVRLLTDREANQEKENNDCEPWGPKNLQSILLG